MLMPHNGPVAHYSILSKMDKYGQYLNYYCPLSSPIGLHLYYSVQGTDLILTWYNVKILALGIYIIRAKVISLYLFCTMNVVCYNICLIICNMFLIPAFLFSIFANKRNKNFL